MVGRDDRDNPGKQSRVAPIPCNKSVLSFCSSIRTKYSMYVRKYCNPSLIYVFVTTVRGFWFARYRANLGFSRILEDRRSVNPRVNPAVVLGRNTRCAFYIVFTRTVATTARQVSCFPNNNTDTARTTMTNVVDQTKHFFYSVSL